MRCLPTCLAFLVCLSASASDNVEKLDELERWVDVFEAPNYVLAPLTGVAEGILIRLDEPELGVEGQELPAGIWLAPWGAELVINGEPVSLGPMWLLSTTNEEEDLVNYGLQCEVRCRSGYYACCHVNGRGQPVCRCRRNGTNDDDCQSGGDGSDSCELDTREFGDRQLN